jgi:hypothetical protein
MNLDEVRVRRAKDIDADKNSLRWILPIARNIIRNMHSEELFRFVCDTITTKKGQLEYNLLTVGDEENE